VASCSLLIMNSRSLSCCSNAVSGRAVRSMRKKSPTGSSPEPVLVSSASKVPKLKFSLPDCDDVSLSSAGKSGELEPADKVSVSASARQTVCPVSACFSSCCEMLFWTESLDLPLFGRSEAMRRSEKRSEALRRHHVVLLTILSAASSGGAGSACTELVLGHSCSYCFVGEKLL
jgi:hypothetical protein